ncbi:methyltransferase domain-containing protein [Verrucosispora sp. WMMA2044]|uniref:class I SAM-dependent methyltransferase n=1 Tax=Verrucosispora sp. WMMA2044 TaxID=3016419 RepID=UPI00248CF769|nr:methyltransferase domain-containing protein [Verrucosispora sp. WMMA2044]WBB50412.1 methyltransferase domain-containing protein [Verrucosispora sp. WMMA2044]
MATDYGLFVREFLRNPARTASIIPSAAAVGRRMAAAVPEVDDPVVVELGPGTGSFTAEIQRRLAARGRHLAVELNDRFATQLQGRFPSVDVAVGDAAQLRRLLDERQVRFADAVISGLPYALFSASELDRMMSAVRESLAPNGTFAAFAYVHAVWTPPARRFYRLLRGSFRQVDVSKAVWHNMPPAFVYTARHALAHLPQQRGDDRSERAMETLTHPWR